jgi:hypothetical protein
MSADHEQAKAKASHTVASKPDEKSAKSKPMKHPVRTTDGTMKEAPPNTKGRIIGRRSDHDVRANERADKPDESWTWILVGRGYDDGVGESTPAVLDRHEVTVREAAGPHACWALVAMSHDEILKSSMQVVFNPE